MAGKYQSCGASDGIGSNAAIFYQSGIAADNSGNVYVADGYYDVLAKINSSGVVTTIAGSYVDGGDATNFLGNLPGKLLPTYYVAVDKNGTLYATSGNAVLKIRQP